MMARRQNLNKNALSAFEEYGVQNRRPPKVEIINNDGPDHKPIFVASARLGEDEICQERGYSKLEARLKAAERALQMLSVQDSQLCNNVSNSVADREDNGAVNPIPCKDPVSVLMEYGQQTKQEINFKLLSQEGPPHMPVFKMCVMIGETQYPEVQDSSRKSTKKKAACVALNRLHQTNDLSQIFPNGIVAAVVSSIQPSKSSTSLGIPGKNPVSVLNEYAQKISKRLSFEAKQSGLSHKPVFTVWAVMDGEAFPEVESTSKKQGNVLAADKAIQVLTERGEHVMAKCKQRQPNGSMKLEPSNGLAPVTTSHADNIHHLVMRKMDEVLLQTPESLVGRKVVAAIVLTDSQTEVSRVVSLGTGNRCIRGNNIADNGGVVHDSHAEILARRAFKRFLYSLLRSDKNDWLYQKKSGELVFRPNISFHMFISTAPCGDGALFSHSCSGTSTKMVTGEEHNPTFSNRRTQGLFRAKQENGEGTIPIEGDYTDQTFDGIQQGGRLRIMSCSDKICQWNVVGLQGALLSKLFEPIYLKSIILGNLFNAHHLSRALCCRVEHKNNRLPLPPMYHVNHPDLEVTTSQDTNRAVKAGSLSINWSFGDQVPEITDGATGLTSQTINSRPGPSRLCKKEMLKLYRETTNNISEMSYTYKQIKYECDSYNQAKFAFRQRMTEQGYGRWISMPPEVNRFLLKDVL